MSLKIDALVLQRVDGVRLLGPLDLSLASGDRLGLVGESGSGKSLLIQALFGVLPPGVVHASGLITLSGLPLVGAEPTRGATGSPWLSWVPQDPGQALNPLLTVAEHLALLPAVHLGEPRSAALSRLAPLLRRLRLPCEPAFLDRFPHQISGGERQRTVLAMALSCNPELMVLDEPTTALDPLAQREFMDLVLGLQKERGLGFLWITHDLALASETCDRLLVLYGGEPMEAGPAAELFSSPRHPYTVRLMQAARNLSTLDTGFLTAPHDRPEGCPFQPRCHHRQASCAHWAPWRTDQRRHMEFKGLDFGLRCEHPHPIQT
jgi:oligopeptide/dipeptide ABC transporter ATP-binding protein